MRHPSPRASPWPGRPCPPTQDTPTCRVGLREHPAPQTAQAPTPPQEWLIRLSFTHSFFLCLLSSSHIRPVELLGKSNVRPSSCSEPPCCICLPPPPHPPPPPAQGHWKEPLQSKKEQERRLLHQGRGLGHKSPKQLLGQSARPGGVHWLGRVGVSGPGCPITTWPARSFPVTSSVPVTISSTSNSHLSLSLSLLLCAAVAVLVHWSPS